MNILDPLIWLVNGLLLIIYLLVDHLVVLAVVPVLTWLAWSAPVEQRSWLFAAAGIAVGAAALVPQPVPVIVLLMALAGAAAVRLDRFNPEALRWRIWGGLAIYSLAALGFAAYAGYASRLDPREWAGILAQGEAAAVVAQGRAFLTTIAVWGIWIILPLGYLAMIVQGTLVHPPVAAAPSDLLYSIRSRSQLGGKEPGSGYLD